MPTSLKELPSRLAVAVFAITLVVSSTGAGSNGNLPSAPATWHAANLPFRPMCIAASQNAIWVGGVDEMLAKSTDGGTTWQVKHQKIDGEVLLAVGFLGGDTIYAAGTNGIMEWSQDGGETWKSWISGSGRVTNVAFSDLKHGIRSTISGIQTTHDGGSQWSDVTNETLSEYSEINGIGALDSLHQLVLLHKPEGENMFLSTADGGKNWTPLHIDNTYAEFLFVHNGQYWAFGMEIVDRKNHGGYSVPLALRSVDGTHWSHGAKAPNEFNACTTQGCNLFDGAIAELYGEKPEYFAFSADEVLTPKWAFAGSSICTIRSSVLCTDLAPSEKVPMRPVVDHPISMQPYGPMFKQPPDCLSCYLHPFPVDKSLLPTPALQANLQVRYRLRKDGTISDVQMIGAPFEQIKGAILQDVQSWVFDPAHGEVPPMGIEHEVKITVTCMAFPSSPRANCTAFMPSVLPNSE